MKFKSGRQPAVGQQISDSSAESGPPTEAEIGQVLLDIQSFAESTTGQAKAQAELEINQARAHAQQIVERAAEEAGTIRSNAALTPGDARELIVAIDEFSKTNRDLLAALLQLRDYLEPPPPPPPPLPPPPPG
jgi:cell division septum initiation protein DivIVA